MPKCEFCGRELNDGEACGCQQETKDIDFSRYFQITLSKDALKNAKNTLNSLRENLSSQRESDFFLTGGLYENNMQITDECVVSTEQEIPIRQYNIAKLRTPLWKKAYGRLQVTNKRVLFRAKGRSLSGAIETESEFSLEELGGIEIKTDYRFNFLLFILSTLAIFICGGVYFNIMRTLLMYGLRESMAPFVILSVLVTAAAVAALLLIPQKVWKSTLMLCAGASWTLLGYTIDTSIWKVIGTVLLLAGIALWILSALVDDLRIILRIKGGHPVIEIGRKMRTFESSGFSVVQPWKDTGIAIRELGALIDDVKRLGNAGIEKWKV